MRTYGYTRDTTKMQSSSGVRSFSVWYFMKCPGICRHSCPEDGVPDIIWIGIRYPAPIDVCLMVVGWRLAKQCIRTSIPCEPDLQGFWLNYAIWFSVIILPAFSVIICCSQHQKYNYNMKTSFACI